MGKSRVAPLKTLTIPRLELSAAVVYVKMSAFLRKELEYSEMEEFFWTDSRVVLGYLSNNARKFHVFVANRIQTIRDQTQREQWNYIRTDENPADDGSRGVSATNFVKKSKWLTGPLFLWKPELPSTEPVESEAIPADDPEVKKGQTLMTKCDSAEAFQLQRLSYFSKWYNMRRAVANCLKLKERLRNWKSPSDQDNTQTQKPVSVEQIQQAETEILKLVQQEMFPEELKVLRKLKVTDETCDRKVAVERKTAIKKASNLYKLDPFLDENGVIRVGGRIRKAEFSYGIKHPVILPRKHHITTVVIRHFHERIQHQGRGMTITELRSNGFWVSGCSSAVSHYIMNCVVCRKLRTKTQDQKMADLTKDRLEETAPFTYCAVDYFGPWIIKEGRKELKRYGALFTYMTSRAIHIEVANSLTTDSFINALRRFISVRGPVRQMRSDQGTNFVGADRELREAVLEMDSDHIRKYLQAENCDFIEFKRNVPSASHMGGVWERQIRTVRSVLGPLMRVWFPIR